MAEVNKFGDIAGLDDLTSFIDRYCMEFMTPDCQFDAVIQTVLDMSHDDLIRLSADSASAYAFKMHSYCIFLRKDMDKASAKLLWCEEILHKIVSKHWKDHSEYMKYEVKRHAIISEDTFAVKVEKMRVYLSGAIIQVERKLDHVKRMADILQDMGKRKSYDR